jgi:hypothetical protein
MDTWELGFLTHGGLERKEERLAVIFGSGGREVENKVKELLQSHSSEPCFQYMIGADLICAAM